MARKNGKPQRPGISSKIKTVPGGLEWGETSRNAGTLKKIIKATQEEKELESGVDVQIIGNEIKSPKLKKKKYITGIRIWNEDDLEYDDNFTDIIY